MSQTNFGGENFYTQTGKDNTNFFGGEHKHYHGSAQRSLTGIPHNLTLIGAATFVGREDDMNLLHEQLQQGTTVAISAVAGMGGVGKTELALQYALRHLEQQTYKGGICWLAARQEIGTQLVTFARSGLDLQPPNDLELVDRVRWCWQRWEGSVLLVLDDVQKYEAIQPYLPPNEARFKVVLTSRSTFGSPVRNLELKVLTEWAALELLRSLVTDERIDEQLEQAKWICGWLGCLPLGLELVGRYLAQKPDLSLEKLRQRLEAQRLNARVFELTPEMRGKEKPYENLAKAFELSWQELDARAQQVAMLLSLFALAEIPWELVQSCLIVDEEELEELEELRDLQLVKLSLLERKGERPNYTYQLHQLLREFFTAKLEPMEFADALKQRFCRVLVLVGQQIPQTPTLSIMMQVTPAIPHMKQAATTLAPWLTDTDLILPATSLGRFYEGQSAFVEAEAWYQHCRQLAEVRFGDDHVFVATCLNNLAELYRALGRYSEAEPLFLQSLPITELQLGKNHPDVASTFNNLALLYSAQKRYSEAKTLLLRSLVIRKKRLGDDHLDVATSLNNLAGLYQSQGRYDKAETYFLRSLAIREKHLGIDHLDAAQSLNNLAGLYQSQGYYAKAETYFLRSLAIREKHLGIEHLDVVQSFNNLAGLYQSQGYYAKAEPLFLQILVILINRLGAGYLKTQTVLQNFILFLQQVIQAGRTAELSDHPITQSLLQQIQADH